MTFEDLDRTCVKKCREDKYCYAVMINFNNANKYSTSYKLRFCEFLHSADTPVAIYFSHNLPSNNLRWRMFVYYCNTGSDIKFRFRK